MRIELAFDYYSRIIYVPDGYIKDFKQLQNSFLEWIQQQPDNIVKAPDNRWGYSYNEDDFVRYINIEVLGDSKEKAYVVSSMKRNGKIENKIMF